MSIEAWLIDLLPTVKFNLHLFFREDFLTLLGIRRVKLALCSGVGHLLFQNYRLEEQFLSGSTVGRRVRLSLPVSHLPLTPTLLLWISSPIWVTFSSRRFLNFQLWFLTTFMGRRVAFTIKWQGYFIAGILFKMRYMCDFWNIRYNRRQMEGQRERKW